MNGRSTRWLLTATLVAGCQRPAPPPAAPPPAPVTVTKAALKTVPVQLKVIGNVRVISTVAVRPQVGGLLLDVHFREGDFVSKGQKLFTIDPKPYQAAVRQAKANLAKSQAVLAGAEQTLGRLERLGRGTVSIEEVDAARTAVGSARATVEADEAALHSSQIQERYTTILCPIDGRAGALLVTAGNLVSSTDATPLVIVNQITPIHVAFAIPEQRLPAVAAAQRNAPLRVEADLRNGDPPVVGALAFIDNAVDMTTGTVQLKGEFKNEDRRLWPGQFVDVVLTIRERPNSVVVPSEAVQSGQQGEYVFVVTDENTAAFRPVKVEFEHEGEAVIASGLSVGETVVLEGQLRVAPKGRVEIKNAPSKEPSAATDGAAKEKPAAAPETKPAGTTP
jgi:multidrug efflux system membrane fusion protein